MAFHRGRVSAELLAEQGMIGTVATVGAIGTFDGLPGTGKTPEHLGKVPATTVQIRNHTGNVAGKDGKTQVNETEIQAISSFSTKKIGAPRRVPRL